MATQSELNQFRRLVGDYGKDRIDATIIDSYLDDAVAELTADFVTPVVAFNTLVVQYRPEVILRAAINWWWDYAAKMTDHHQQTLGQSTQNAGEKWDRAMEMIKRLEERYQIIQQLGTDITIGNLSRFSKLTLTRIGGVSEETAKDAF